MCIRDRPQGWRTTEQNVRIQHRLASLAARVRFAPDSPELDASTRSNLRWQLASATDHRTWGRLITTSEHLTAAHTFMPDEALVAIFDIACDLPAWPAAFERLVALKTGHVSPTLRRAAYAAIASRTSEQNPVAKLAAEAALDCDADVRAIASQPSSSKRNQRQR